jgi:hypothetical protein
LHRPLIFFRRIGEAPDKGLHASTPTSASRSPTGPARLHPRSRRGLRSTHGQPGRRRGIER